MSLDVEPLARKLEGLFLRDNAKQCGETLAIAIRRGVPSLQPIVLAHPLGDAWWDFLQQAMAQYFESRSGTVYALSTAQYPEVLKVGKTRLTVATRVHALNSEVVIYPFKVEGAWPVHDCHRVERAAHVALARQGVQQIKEFFKTSRDAVEAVVLHETAQDQLLFEKQGFYIFK